MRIPRHFAQERMEPSRMPRAPAWYLSQTGGGLEAEGIVGFSRAMQDVSGDVIERMINRRTQTQQIEGTSFWERQHTQFFTDLTRDQDYENYGKKYKAFAKSLRRQIIKKGLTSPARQNLEAYIETQQVKQEKEVAVAYLKKQVDYGRAATFKAVNDFEMDGDANAAVSALNTARNTGFISAQEAEVQKQNVRRNIQWYAGERLANNRPDVFLANYGEEGFLANLNPSEKQRLKDEAERKLSQIKKQTDEQLETQQEQDRDKLNDALNAGTLTYGMIDVSSLDEKEQRQYRGWMIQETDRIAKGEVIATDQKTRADLYTMALDIWRGTVSKKEFDESVNEARFGKEPTIDDDAYKSLTTTAATTLKSAQAEALRRADTEAGRLIVDYREESAAQRFISDVMKGLKPDKAKLFEQEFNERRKLQFWFLSQYNKAMRDWITENPDKVGKDFYQYSEMLKHQYWNTSMDEIERRRARAGKRVGIDKYSISQPKPTAEELKRDAASTNDLELRRQIYEYGKTLGYWK